MQQRTGFRLTYFLAHDCVSHLSIMVMMFQVGDAIVKIEEFGTGHFDPVSRFSLQEMKKNLAVNLRNKSTACGVCFFSCRDYIDSP